MFTLKNDTLTVRVLDPVADRERFGTRYCTGGYIFQIDDKRLGPLLSGPTYPDSFNTFDGQGIPDAFNLDPLRGDGTEVAIIGIGVCDLQSNTVREFCAWEVAEWQTHLRMRTTQRYHHWAFTLTRTITLTQRTVRSHTELHNHGAAPVPVRWFPHPFYPQCTDTDDLCKLNVAVDLPEKGYALAPNDWITRRGWPWSNKGGEYQALTHDATEPLMLLQRHPALGMAAARCSYVPDFFPIWGNLRTFSWEPFLERTVAIGQRLAWHIDYDF
jgi:hypothetical protein